MNRVTNGRSNASDIGIDMFNWFSFFFWKQELHSINFFLTTVLPQLLKIKHWSLIIEFFPIFSFCFSFNVTLINNKVTATEYQ